MRSRRPSPRNPRRFPAPSVRQRSEVMKLAALLDDVRLAAEPALLDREIAGITSDSRKVQAGYVFAALPGSKADGRAFIADAVARGAAAVLTEESTTGPGPFIRDKNPRRRLALMAA